MWITKSHLIIVTIVLITVQFQIDRSEGASCAQTTVCVGLSILDFKGNGKNYKQTIGSVDFFRANEPAWPYKGVIIDRSTTFNSKIYAVHVDGKLLRGWFHIELTVPTNLASFILNGVDEDGKNVGEFVYNFPKCGDSGHDQNDYTEYMYLPCGGVAPKEPLMSSGIKFLRNPNSNRHLVPSNNLDRTKFHFMYRLPTAPCTQPKSVAIYAVGAELLSNRASTPAIFMSHSDQVFLKASETIGATDPIPREGTYQNINCHANINDAPYVSSVTAMSQPTSSPCTVRYRMKLNAEQLFIGRCSATHTIQCPDASVTDGLVKYDVYIAEMIDRQKYLCIPCGDDVPPRPFTSAPNIATGKPPVTLEEDKHGVPLSLVTALEVWDGRIIHGIVMTIIAIFLLPVNIFLTRHFKETFMARRILFLRVWFFFHHFATGLIVVCYFPGFSRMYRNHNFFGVNLHVMASIHRHAGWTTVGITLLMTIFGGWRCIQRTARNCCIALHWGFGMAVYVINYVLMIQSASIPGSPSAAEDVTQALKGSGATDTSGKFEVIVILVCAWIVIDIGLHVAITVLTCMSDKKCQLSHRRLYLPTPIPVLYENVTQDIKGSKLRIILLIVYASLSFCFAMGICYFLITQDTTGRGLGEMSCTRKPRGKGVLSANDVAECE